jgi:hypothetical protein
MYSPVELSPPRGLKCTSVSFRVSRTECRIWIPFRRVVPMILFGSRPIGNLVVTDYSPVVGNGSTLQTSLSYAGPLAGRTSILT